MFPARLKPGLPSPASFLRLRLQAQLFLLTLSYASLACPDVLSSGHLRPCSSLPCSRLLIFRGPSVFVSRHPRSFYHIASSPTPPLLLEHGPSPRGHCSHCYLHCRRAGQWPVSGGTPPSLPLVPRHPNCQVRRTQAPAPQPSSGHSCPQGGSLPPTLSLGGRACGAASQCSPACLMSSVLRLCLRLCEAALCLRPGPLPGRLSDVYQPLLGCLPAGQNVGGRRVGES